MPEKHRSVPRRIAPVLTRAGALALIASFALIASLSAASAAMPARRHSLGQSSAPPPGPVATPTLTGMPPLIVAEPDASGREAAYTLMGREARIAFGAAGIAVTSFEPAPPRRSTGRPLGDGIWQRQTPGGSSAWEWDPEPLPVARPLVAVTFLGARPGAQPAGVERRATTVSHFRGPRESWRTGLSTYGGVVYRDL